MFKHWKHACIGMRGYSYAFNDELFFSDMFEEFLFFIFFLPFLIVLQFSCRNVND